MRVRRLLATTVAGLATTAVLGTTAPPAHASMTVGGRYFDTTVNCGGSFMDVTSHTSTDNGAYVMIYVRAYSNGQWTSGWMSDNQWQRADAWSSFFVPNVRTSYGYYAVYAYYASYTNAGWQISGEYITSFRQKSGYNAAGSSTCLMGV